VLILPSLGREDLFREFHLDEPWDSPHNLTLLLRMPVEYAPPPGADFRPEPHATFFQVIVGPGAAFEGKEGLHLPADFSDGTSNTLMVVEAATAVPWTSPSDVVFTPTLPLPALGGVFTGRSRFGPLVGSLARGFHAACADGSVRFVSGVSDETLRAAITRNGGEVLGSDW
jgi:hypothetical protein